jgi:16S rRNA (guanine966-N2)-methyltransferase
MRITGGKACSLQLKSPKGDFIRPSADSSRERLFGVLGGLLDGCTFLDLFAGTGACGLEAISRGSNAGIFVEKHPKALNTLRANVASVTKATGGDPGKFHVCRGDVLKWRPPVGTKFDLVFIDPPYSIIDEILPPLFTKVGEWLADGGFLVFEMPGGKQWAAEGWEEFRKLGKKGKGDPTQRFIRPC